MFNYSIFKFSIIHDVSNLGYNFNILFLVNAIINFYKEGTTIGVFLTVVCNCKRWDIDPKSKFISNILKIIQLIRINIFRRIVFSGFGIKTRKLGF